MKKLTIGFITFIFLAIFFSQYHPSHFVVEAAPVINTNNRINLKFKSGISRTIKNTFYKKHKLSVRSDILPNLQTVNIDPSENLQTRLAIIKADKNIEFAEEDKLVPATAITETVPNDPGFASQYYLSKLMATRAWTGQKATDIRVGICDSGYEASHPDLVGSFLPSLGYNVVDGSADWSPVASHGTWVAGIISANTNNSLGIASLAWGAKIIPIKITNRPDALAYYSDMAKCINYATANGAKVVNISYEGARWSDAVNAAASYQEGVFGTITVVSAGNNAVLENNLDYDATISVSATTANDTLSSFSSYGNYVDIAAPGSAIYTTSPGGSYTLVDGTSFSAPIVVAAVALISAKNPTATPDQIKQILFTSADDIGPVGDDVYFGAGRVNVCKAIYGASSPNCGFFSGLSATLKQNQATFNFTYPLLGQYRVQLSTNSTFTGSVYNNFGLGTVSPIVVNNPVWTSYVCNAPLWWRVISPDNIYSVPSQTFVNCLSTPVLMSPFSGQVATVPRPPLVWVNAPVGTTDGYQLQLSTTPDFSTTVFPQATITYTPSCAQCKKLQNWFPPTNLQKNTRYYWRVRSYSNYTGGLSAWSETRNFTVTY